MRFSTEERIAIVRSRLRGRSYKDTQEEFRRKFHKDAPTRANIRVLLNKFNRTGSVSDEQHPRKPRVDGETVERVNNAISRSPQASTRRLSRELDIPRSTVWKILRFVLKKRAYHIQVLHKLDDEDNACRQAMCMDLVEAVNNDNLLGNILFSDEARFHVCGLVNKHNCRVWASEQPNVTIEWERNTPCVNVWLGLTQNKCYGPFFFAEATVTGVTYLDMLQQFLQPQLEEDGITDTVVYQQDGAPPHFALIVRSYLDEMFPGRWIGRGSPRLWAPRSPDLTPLDFFAWGYIKNEVYRTRVRDLQDLRQRIRHAVDLITPRMLRAVFRSTTTRWEKCINIAGGHVELY